MSLPFFFLLLLQHATKATMEDFNDTAAGCVVISCCCPCLLLQLALFVFLRLPRRLVVKSKKMIMTRKMKNKKSTDIQETKKIEESKQITEEMIRDGGEMTLLGDEEMWEELARQGMFWFGSFWREGEAVENFNLEDLWRLDALEQCTTESS